jgi:type IV secretory pathway TraG/TraD family ATPase VirD4
MSDNEFLRGKPRNAKDEQFLNFLMKVIMLLAVFIGIWAGTQRFCRSVGYDPGWVGQPFFVIKIGKFTYPLYQPFLIFYWIIIYYKRTEIHALLYSAVKITGIVSFSSIVFYFLVEFIIMKNIAQNIFGTARWGTKKDLEKAGLLQNKGGIRGRLQRCEPYRRHSHHSGIGRRQRHFGAFSDRHEGFSNDLYSALPLFRLEKQKPSRMPRISRTKRSYRPQ